MIEGMKGVMARVFEVYIQSLPGPVAEKASLEFPGPADCYRIKDDPGHYMLVGFEEPELDIDQGGNHGTRQRQQHSRRDSA